MIPTDTQLQPTSSTRKGSPAPPLLFACMAAGTLLSGVLPLSDYGDGKLFDTGALYVLALGVPAGLLVLAAVLCSTKPDIAGLGGGVSLGLASLLGALAIVIWKTSGGDGLGVGSYVLTATAILGYVTFLVSLGVPVAGIGTPAHWLAVLAGFAMSLGCTLVPSDRAAYGTTWKDFNGFGDGADGLLAFAYQSLLWMPLVAVLIGAVKGGRFGALLGLGGSVILAWFVFASKAEVFTEGYVQAFALSADVHPVAVFGAVAVLVLGVVAFSVSPASEASPPPFGATDLPYAATPYGVVAGVANPGRWADDPFGRHASRYWSGSAWTDHVANGGITSIDPAVAHPAPPTVQPPVLPSAPAPVSPFVAPVPSSFVAQPTPLAPLIASPIAPVARLFDDATVPRGTANSQPIPIAELVLDTGQRVALVGPVVIGRAPRAQPSEPMATLLALDDNTMSVSATHLIVGPAPTGAWVHDVGSTNGSSVVDPSGVTTTLLPGVRVLISNGSSIRFGDRSGRLVVGEGK